MIWNEERDTRSMNVDVNISHSYYRIMCLCIQAVQQALLKFQKAPESNKFS